MKRILLTLAFAVVATALNAQSMKVQSAISDSKNDRLDKAKANIDDASNNESTKNDAKTWRYKAEIYYKIATTTKDKFKNLDPNPLQVATEAAFKSIDLDKEQEFTRFNYTILNNVISDFFQKGSQAFSTKEYDLAETSFNQAATIGKKINNQKVVNDAHFNASIAVENSKTLTPEEKTAKIKTIYTELANAGYANPRVYAVLYQSDKTNKDMVNALAIAQKSADVGDKLQAQAAATQKPAVGAYVYYSILADAYYSEKNMEKGDEVVAKILAMEPNNPAVLNEVGTMYEGIGKNDEAMKKYEESLALKADQYDANYNIGAWYFNRGVDKVEEADKVPGNDKTGLYDKLMAESADFFNKAIPYLEKARSFKPNDMRALIGLKQIYARTNQLEKVKEIDEKLKEVN